MAQNLDRFRTFPRLAGGKGPLSQRPPWGPREPSLTVLKEEKAEVVPPWWGGAALQELSSEGPPGRSLGSARSWGLGPRMCGSFIYSSLSKWNIKPLWRHFLDTRDAGMARGADPALGTCVR